MLVAAIMATAPGGWLPAVANVMIREALRERKLSAIEVRVQRLTPWNLRASLQLGTNAPDSQIEGLDVHFSPGGLWQARVDRVEVNGGLLQFRSSTNGMVLCGLPDLTTGRRSGFTPGKDQVTIPWRVGKVLVDHVTLRLLPPDQRAMVAEPFDICVQASAVSGAQGELRLALADFGHAGTLIKGEVRLDTGDGWLMAVLPDRQVQEWLRVAQWYVTNPEFHGSDLCAGQGGATILARMQQWRPALVQGDCDLRAASQRQDCHLDYDLHVQGRAQWDNPQNLRPTISAHADFKLRRAMCRARVWSDDCELPATANIDVQLTPQPAAWACRVAGRAMLSREAAQTCVPPGTVQFVAAPQLRVDGVFTSPDLRQWDGTAEALLRVAQPQVPGDLRLVCSDVVLQATAIFSNSVAVGVHGWAKLGGLTWGGGDVRCAGEMTAGFETCAPFEDAAVVVTSRLASVTLSAGTLAIADGQPLVASAAATVYRAAGAIGFGGLTLQVEPTLVNWKSGDGAEVTAWGAFSGNVTTQDDRWRIGAALSLTNIQFHTSDLTGGLARVDVTSTGEMTHAMAFLSARRLAVTARGGWLRDGHALLVEGVQADVPLESTPAGLRVNGAPALTWSNLMTGGVHLQPEGFALSTTGQTASAELKVGLPEAGLHATVQAHADWSRAWHVALTAAVPPTVLADTAALRGLIRQLSGQDLSVTGEVSAVASTLLAAGKSTRVQVTVAVTNLDLGSTADKWQIAGIATRVTADGPQAWRTSQGEVLTFQSAKKGNVVCDGGRVQWQFRREALLVEQADVNWCNGMLHMYGLVYDLHQPDLDFVVYADRVQLGALMTQTRALSGTGQGRLFGRIPIKISRGQLHLTESYLNTMPGETGVVKLSDISMIDSALAANRVDATVRERLRNALGNLMLTVFRVQLSGGGEDAVLGVHIEGRPADNPTGQGVDLNVNLHGPMDQLFHLGEKAAETFQ